jgi:histidine triad (HIT) family protein
MAFEAYNEDNVFAKIIKGDIPSFKLFENKTTLAILDAFPQAEGHTLVIPKGKGSTCFLNMKINEDFFKDLQKVANAVQKAFNADGVKLIANSGGASGQTVFHPHFHIVPQFEGKEFTGKPASDMLKADDAKPLQAKIKEALKPPPKPLKKAKFGKVANIKPDSTGLNLQVKVTGDTKTVENKGKTFNEVIVGDASSSVVLSLKEDQVSSITKGSTIDVRNARSVMVNGRIRLAVDKWGKIAASSETVDEVNATKNISETEYELVKS